MGTNYYHRYNACDCCKRYDERHICKSKVMFQGYFEDGEWDGERRAYLPDMPVIASWQDWKRALLDGGEIWDEYGAKIDTTEFIASVEATQPESRSRQYNWMRDNGYQTGFGREWRDSEGFSFSIAEFS